MAEIQQAPHYLVNEEGLCFYPIIAPVLSFGDDGTPTARVMHSDLSGGYDEIAITAGASNGGPGHTYHNTQWYITNGPVDYFAFPRRPHKVTEFWRLKDETAASEKFPVSLTVQEYKARREVEDPDGDGEGLTYIMYAAVTKDVAMEPVLIDVSAMTPLPGSADVHSGWTWEVERTAGLTYGTYYYHELPGTLHGVRDRLAAAIEAVFGKHDLFKARGGLNRSNRNNMFEVHLNLPYDVPVFRNVPKTSSTGRKLKGTSKVNEFVSVDVEWSPPGTIKAKNKAAAVAYYQRLETETIEWLRSYDVVACSACKGHGYTRVSGPRPT